MRGVDDGRPRPEAAGGGEHLAVHRRVLLPHALRRLAARELEHRLPPRPEVAALDPAPERALERVAVGVDEARELESVAHARQDTPVLRRLLVLTAAAA